MSDAENSDFLKELHQEYSDWASQVIRAAFYPDKVLRASVVAPALLRNNLDQAQIADLADLQKDMHVAADAMLGGGQDKPPFEAFDKFLTLYETFNERIERLEMDSVLSNFGVDVETGLRSANVIVADLERELERRARKGQPFSIVLCQVNRADPATIVEELKLASEALKMCMRSFDDAYLSGPNEILVSLKQTENEGALKFVERLKNALARKNASFTMSYCVATPAPGENVDTLLKHVRGDLKIVAEERMGKAVEFDDISPLQRFINSAKEDK